MDIAAPGGNIYTTGLNDTCEYANGTSMTAAYVTGASAIYLGTETTYPPNIIKLIINASSKKTSMLQSNTISQGYLDITAMLEYE